MVLPRGSLGNRRVRAKGVRMMAMGSTLVIPAHRVASRSASAIRHSGATSRSEEHTSELQSLMRISYAVFCLKKKKNKKRTSMSVQTMKQETYKKSSQRTTVQTLEPYSI